MIKKCLVLLLFIFVLYVPFGMCAPTEIVKPDPNDIIDRIIIYGKYGSTPTAIQSTSNGEIVIDEVDPLNNVVDVYTTGNNTLITPATGKYIKIYAYDIMNMNNVSMFFHFGATNKSGVLYGTHLERHNYPYIWKGAINQAFCINLSASKNVTGNIQYAEF